MVNSGGGPRLRQDTSSKKKKKIVPFRFSIYKRSENANSDPPPVELYNVTLGTSEIAAGQKYMNSTEGNVLI